MQKRYSDYFPDSDLQQIREHDIDVALRFGFRILRGKALEIARFGVWSYHHGDNRMNRGGPPGFWEVFLNNPVTGSVLQQLTERLDDGRILYRSYSSTDSRSVYRNKNRLYWKSATFVMRALHRLAEEGDVTSAAEDRDYQPYTNPLYKVPTNRQMVFGLLSLGQRYARDKLRNTVLRQQWTIAYKKSATIADAFYDFKVLRPPRDRFWADPFPWKQEGKHYIFIEELAFRRGLGHLSVVPIGQGGEPDVPVKILERDYHLSYPQVFEWEGQLYMMPETARNRTLEVYRCDRFPDRWTLYRTVMKEVSIFDATLFEQDGAWWLFASMGGRNYSENDELYLFKSDTPLGPWRPHRRNPVKSDVRSSRPAGKLFHHNGAIYRPAQDSSDSQRYRVMINKVEILNENSYLETHLAEIGPYWKSGLNGVHTLNYIDGLTVIDIMTRRLRLGA